MDLETGTLDSLKVSFSWHTFKLLICQGHLADWEENVDDIPYQYNIRTYLVVLTKETTFLLLSAVLTVLDLYL